MDDKTQIENMVINLAVNYCIYEKKSDINRTELLQHLHKSLNLGQLELSDEQKHTVLHNMVESVVRNRRLNTVHKFFTFDETGKIWTMIERSTIHSTL